MAMRAGIFLLILLAPYFERSKLALASVQSIYLLVLGAVLLGWVFSSMMKNRVLGRGVRLGVPIVLLLLSAAVSLAFVAEGSVGTREWMIGWYRFSALLLVFPMVSYFDSPRRAARLVHVFLFSALLASLYWLLETGSLPFPGLSSIPIFSRTYYEARGLAMVSSDIYFWGLLLAVPVLTTARRSLAARTALSALTLLLALRWVLEFSKSQLVIGLLLLGLFGLSLLRREKTRSRRRLFVMLTLLAIGFGLFSAAVVVTESSAHTGLLDVYTKRFSRVSRSVSYRLSEWSAVFEQVAERPLLGHGYGAVFYHVRPQGAEGAEVVYSWVHNAPLYFLFHAGALGLLAALWIVWRIGWLVRSGFRVTRDGPMRGYVVGLALMFAGMLLRALLSTSFIGMSFSLALAMVAAVAFRLGRPPSGAQSVTVARVKPPAATGDRRSPPPLGLEGSNEAAAGRGTPRSAEPRRGVGSGQGGKREKRDKRRSRREFGPPA